MIYVKARLTHVAKLLSQLSMESVTRKPPVRSTTSPSMDWIKCKTKQQYTTSMGIVIMSKISPLTWLGC